MITNELVSKAIVIATQYHERQRRWNGDPYILHPIRVMSKMKSNTGRAIAVLHDTVEDTGYTEADLRNDFPEEIANRVMTLTHLPNQEYFQYIAGITTDAICASVKIADIEDNLDLWDLQSGEFGLYVNGKHMDRMNRYLKALYTLKGCVPEFCKA